VKKISCLIAFAIILSGCTKERAANPNPQNPLVEISLAPILNDSPASNAWTQVLGGKAAISFQMSATDNLSASNIQDSVSLKDIATYKHDILAGNYTITLNRTNTIPADTFIRFNAQVKDLSINKDQAISLPATTTDAVITVSKSLIQDKAIPTFTDAVTGTAYKFRLANGYYYVYVKDASTGRMTFTEATSGDIYWKDITVAAQNRYDITLVPNKTNAVNIKKQALDFKGFLNNVQ
jgi:hypothetical protein